MKTLLLNGQWTMYEAGTDTYHEALVPGSVYSDLMRDDSMPDPFYRENELAAFDLLRKDWVYTRTFTVDDALFACRHIELCCEGLDTIADVTINGQDILHADNMHITWIKEIRDALCEGENTITVTFRSPIEYCLKAGEEYPAWHSTDAIPGFPRLRKAACMFGWDWGPRLPDAGIWRDIRLMGWNDVRLVDAHVEQFHEDGKVRLRVTPAFVGDAAAAACTVTVTAPDGHVMTADVENGCAELIIEEPELWWPNGYGAQPLYQVSVKMTGANDVDEWTRRIGLRTMTMHREKDQWGESFCHEVNGVRIFAMGADYIPEDNILSRMSPERSRRLLEDSVRANFNVVRVWGGGFYPSDDFYDICDELGLIVWQDLAYACAYYDLDEDFERSIVLETEQNVRRLRHHASLGLICGNNEMESFHMDGIRCEQHGDYRSFGPVRPNHHPDYIKMFEYILPKVVKEHAPEVYWWPASPSSGGNFDDPNGADRGDTHYWDVWHGEKPFTEYRKFFFRYASEFGFQSFPCLQTVETFTEPGDRNIFSRIMERHQRNRAANGKILSYMSQTYRYPGSFDNLLYCSQLLQADAIRYGVQHWRRIRGRCMGAVIWQLNDCWPVASWSSIDYYGRWKAMHYAAKRFFAPVMISVHEEGEVSQNPCINEFMTTPIERSARLSVANETMQDVTGTVRWKLCDPTGKVLESDECELTVPALTSVWMDKLEFPQASLTGTYFVFDFVVNGQTVSYGTCLFCAPKHFEFCDPNLTVRLDGDEIVVSADAFAKYVYIQSDDADLLLDDNFFDMQPGERRIRIIRGNAENGLRVRSVYDLDR